MSTASPSTGQPVVAATTGPHPEASESHCRPPTSAGTPASTGSGSSQAPSFPSIFKDIWTKASEEYKSQTGEALDTQKLYENLDSATSVDSVTKVLEAQVAQFSDFRKSGLTRLKPLVGIVLILSDTLAGGISLVNFPAHAESVYTYLAYAVRQTWSPAGTVFTGIGVLLRVSPLPCLQVARC